MTPRGIGAVVLIGIIGFGAAAGFTARRHREALAATTIPPALRAPDSVRVRVEVLNGTKTRGLARRATMVLRDRGFDVVQTGTSGDAPHDTTIVIDLSDHPDWAQRMARIMAPARVETRPDSSRYLDISVVLGSTWRPPARPFYP